MRTRVLGGLLAALSAILVAGCSSTPTPPVGDHNPADVAFAQGMLPHHRQAVAMTALAAERTTTPEIRDLAAEIERAQGPEIETMTGMLARWGTPAEDPAGMSGTAGMPGMMSGDAMARLAALSGPAFGRAFLEMMIEHHTGAVQMAATETAQGRDPAALDLARSISAAQQDEIGRMRALLARP